MKARREPPGATGADDRGEATVSVDPRAIRVVVAAATRIEGDPDFILAPPHPASSDDPLVDGAPTPVRLRWLDQARALLVEGPDGVGPRTAVLFGPQRSDRERGIDVREVVVGGWRIEVEVEPERRATLRERARRGAGGALQGGPVDVRAIIPGRIVAVTVAPGDAVEAGQQILVVEAMKMQNELRAPREGIVERVGVAVGDTIEVGDLLVVIR